MNKKITFKLSANLELAMFESGKATRHRVRTTSEECMAC